MALDPEDAFHARASGDAALVALLGNGGIEFGWPGDTLEKSDMPRITFFLVAGTPVRSGWEDGRIQVDAWVWPHTPGEAATGKARVRAIDERMLALFHEKWWTDGDGTRWYAQAGPARDWPSAPNAAMRRVRTITVSRLTGA